MSIKLSLKPFSRVCVIFQNSVFPSLLHCYIWVFYNSGGDGTTAIVIQQRRLLKSAQIWNLIVGLNGKKVLSKKQKKKKKRLHHADK